MKKKPKSKCICGRPYRHSGMHRDEMKSRMAAATGFLDGKPYEGFTPLVKPRKNKPVDLHLTRKDAIQLIHILNWCVPNCITHNTVDDNYTSSTGHDKILTAKRILNKLKREGVK